MQKCKIIGYRHRLKKKNISCIPSGMFCFPLLKVFGSHNNVQQHTQMHTHVVGVCKSLSLTSNWLHLHVLFFLSPCPIHNVYKHSCRFFLPSPDKNRLSPPTTSVPLPGLVRLDLGTDITLNLPPPWFNWLILSLPGCQDNTAVEHRVLMTSWSQNRPPP